MAIDRKQIRSLVIPGIYTPNVGFSFDHCHDFRLQVDGVVMSLPVLQVYFKNGRKLANAEALRTRSQSQVYRQIYFSGLYLYSFLTKAGFDIDLLNCYMRGDPETERALAKGHDVIIVSTTFTWCPQIRPMLDHIRTVNPNAVIVIGGRWVYESYQVWQRRDDSCFVGHDEVFERYFFTGKTPWHDVDLFIVAEHGEDVLVEALDRVADGGSIRDLPNSAHTDETGRVTFERRREEAFDVSGLAIDWDLIPEKHHSTVMPMVAAVGCPFKCKFCDYSLSQYLMKSPEVLREELKRLDTCRFVKTAWFVDDNFFLSPKKVKQFCEMWKEERFRIQWYSIIRPTSITEDTARLMHETGLRMVMLGIESGSQRILDNMNKKVTIEQYRKTFEYLHKYNIRAKILMVIGFPGEDDESIQETIDFLNSLPGTPEIGHELFLSPFCVLPLAYINNEEDRAKFQLEGYFFDWSHRTMKSSEVHDAMKKIYLKTSGIFQYYSDDFYEMTDNVMRNHLVETAVLREELTKAVVSGAAPEIRDGLWDRLEALVTDRPTRAAASRRPATE